jgi:tyrosine-protein phosphatase SIW14
MHLFGRAVRFFLAAGLAAGLLIGPAVAGPASGPPAANAAAISHVRIDNFGQVNPVYFRGAQPEGRDYADLAAAGIRTVIDLQADGPAVERALVEGAGMGFHRIPMTTRTAPTAEQIETFLQLVNEPANQPVYVHCAGGRHRTGVMTAIYRMSGEGWTAEKAFQEMKQYKFGADFLHPEFKRFVYAYQPPAAQPAAKAAIATVHQ